MTKSFSLTSKQNEVKALLAGEQTHSLIYGGSRSGKTFLILFVIIIRAAMAAGSRHLFARLHNVDVRTAVLLGTFPEIMRLAFPNLAYEVNKQDQYVRFPNGSEIWFSGLDDKERVEKILGKEYASIAINEASQVSYETVETVRTRLAQNVDNHKGAPLKLRAYYDLNPSGAKHWTYAEFISGKKPTGELIRDRSDFAYAIMNPSDNPHLPDGYIKQLEGLSSLQRKRFLHGEYLTTAPGSLWTADMLQAAIAKDTPPPEELVSIVVAVDPSGSDGSSGDSQGIIVAGIDRKRHAHVLEDASMRGSPLQWATRVAALYDAYSADKIVAEKNYGGEMVRTTIQMTANRNLPVKLVHSSRGKHLRAEPIAALYEQGKVSHAGDFPKLSDQLLQMTGEGYQGSGSPDRLDALVFALTELGLARVQPVVRIKCAGAV